MRSVEYRVVAVLADEAHNDIVAGNARRIGRGFGILCAIAPLGILRLRAFGAALRMTELL
ncbi:MAG: hypothetical protein ACLSGS_03705 [Adlercreutzia sp.]